MTATAMPKAANCMPRLALSGRPRARRAVMNKNAANRYASWMSVSIMTSRRSQCLLHIARWDGFGALEHRQHPIGDEKATHDVRHGARDGDRAENRCQNAV